MCQYLGFCSHEIRLLITSLHKVHWSAKGVIRGLKFTSEVIFTLCEIMSAVYFSVIVLVFL